MLLSMDENKFEYVVMTSKDQIFVLTLKEKNFLLANEDKRFIDFPGIGTINPAFVTGIKAEKIEVLKDRFPCKKCLTSGTDIETRATCTVCSGTGANIGNK